MTTDPPQDGAGGRDAPDPPHPDGFPGSDAESHYAAPALWREIEDGRRAPAKSEEPMPKQVLVLRTDLKMRKGKAVSQGAHSSGKVFFDTIPRDALSLGFPEGCERVRLTIEVDKPMFMWLAGIFTKVCCRADSEAELLEIYENAKAAGLPCCLITDAGRTEFHGVPTNTAVAVGPAMPEDIDPVTGHLKLL